MIEDGRIKHFFGTHQTRGRALYAFNSVLTGMDPCELPNLGDKNLDDKLKFCEELHSSVSTIEQAKLVNNYETLCQRAVLLNIDIKKAEQRITQELPNMALKKQQKDLALEKLNEIQVKISELKSKVSDQKIRDSMPFMLIYLDDLEEYTKTDLDELVKLKQVPSDQRMNERLKNLKECEKQIDHLKNTIEERKAALEKLNEIQVKISELKSKGSDQKIRDSMPWMLLHLDDLEEYTKTDLHKLVELKQVPSDQRMNERLKNLQECENQIDDAKKVIDSDRVPKIGQRLKDLKLNLIEKRDRRA